MADDPRVPGWLIDVAMGTIAMERMVHFMAVARDERSDATRRWMRADMSSVLAEVLKSLGHSSDSSG